ncbi:MAG: hypothetical protein WED82_01950 [Balneolales bacterium]
MANKFYEILRAGKYPQRDVTEDDIQTLADNYDPEFQESPVTIFHKGDKFAYAWVENLKAEGGKLLASFKDVTPELKELVARKMLKRHSVELYGELPDKGLYLKGVAMLGAEAPAVKGMKPIEFADAESEEFSFEESPSFASDYTADYFEEKAKSLETKNTELKSELDTEKDKVKEFTSKNESIEFTQRKEKFESFLDSKTEGGQLEPKLRDKAVSLFTALDKVVRDDESSNAVELFKDIVGGLKKQIEFGEAFTEGAEEEEISPQKLADQITEYQDEQAKKGKNISYSQAAYHVKNKPKDKK